MMRVKILGTGRYLPKRCIQNAELEAALGWESGRILSKDGVNSRFRAEDLQGETPSAMGAWAAEDALSNSQVNKDDIDLIIYASATAEQAIPDTAPLVQAKLGLGNSGIACFSIHSTCLSFLNAMDVAASFIHSKRYRHILIVCCEISSSSLNPNDDKTIALFGDAAAAVIIGPTPEQESSHIKRIHISTYGDAARLTQVKGGGVSNHPNHPDTRFEDNTFEMNGRELLRQALTRGPAALEKIWPGLSKGKGDIDVFIPHQPSRVGMSALGRYFEPEKTIHTLQEYGNCVSASLPLSLDVAIKSKRLKRNDRALLFGTGAGFSIGGMILEY